MNVDEYLAWAEGRPGRYELVDGTIYAMTPERLAHAHIKGKVYMALAVAIRAGRLSCQALPDGMTVRVTEATAYEPDTLVYCGPSLPPSTLVVPNPVILVEVISPSSRYIDPSVKLAGYFGLPSVNHYLIVDPDRPLVIHHARNGDDAILTRIVRDGSINLDPPGLQLSLADIYGEAPEPLRAEVDAR